jgi:hypothetical protein
MRNQTNNQQVPQTQRRYFAPLNFWYQSFVVHPFVLFEFLAGVLVFSLAACQTAMTPTPLPAETISSTATSAPTLTNTSTPTQVPTSSPTPEPAWYQPLDPPLGLLKYHFAEVIDPHAKVYRSLEDAVAKTGNYGYLPNYPAYVAYATSRSEGGRIFYLVTYGWMEAEKLQPLTPSTFTGMLLRREVPFRFGWVLAETTSVNAAGVLVQTYNRYQIVYEVPAMTENPGYMAVGADEWLAEDMLALVRPQVPADAGPDICRFIYVNLAEQTLSAYDDCMLVFATLISSGANSWTFEGRFAIVYKVEYSTITPPPASTSEYYIEGVPWFMTYSGNFGFHGAYWHDQFGSAASHGCINLSPADANWLYDWAEVGERVIISAGQ